ncbi:MAG TPA: choice-of-anchor D domain-containing protein, partial [Candidatus Cloacimonadota bacterium]|nr:choice-of-anchor D domain-containing protein [Candidatus Cloacimonadota bacterium]
VVQSTDKYSGTYAAKSGAITHSQTSVMSLTLNITSAGNITFYQKVSSESGYDFLYFYLDDVQQGSWSGAGSWTQQFYAVTTGSHTFKWTYSKDGSVSSNSDCAYLDHIIFPPYTVPSTFFPPQNLVAAAGNGLVNLSWQAPATGTPTGYKIYKNSSLLTTVTGLTYTDTAVVNGTTYSYYLIAAYSGGNSDPTATVTATPSTASTITIGTGTTTSRRPIACYYGYERSAMLFTAAEVGIIGSIQTLSWKPSVTTTYAVPTKIYLATTASTALTAVTWATMITGATQVYSGTLTGTTAGTWQTVDITDFTYTTNNLLVLVECNYTGSGTGTSSGAGYFYSTAASNTTAYWNTDDSAPTGNGTLTTARPNIQMVIGALNPVFNLTPASLDFGPIMTGQTATHTFTISNTGNALLTGNITTPTGYSVVQSAKLSRAQVERNTLGYSVAVGSSHTYTVTFAPTLVQPYNGNISITSNDVNHPTNSLSVTGSGYEPILDAPLQVEIQRQSGSVSLSWAAVTNATTYYVYRSTAPGGTYTKIATVTTNSYIVTDTTSMTYFYYVAADRILAK